MPVIAVLHIELKVIYCMDDITHCEQYMFANCIIIMPVYDFTQTYYLLQQ